MGHTKSLAVQTQWSILFQPRLPSTFKLPCIANQLLIAVLTVNDSMIQTA